MALRFLIILILAFSMSCFFSCKQKNSSREKNDGTDLDNLENTTTYYSSNDVDEQEGKYILDEDEFERLISEADIEGYAIQKADFEKYSISKFYPKPELNGKKYKAVKLFDYQFLDNGVEVMMIVQYGGNIDRVWFTSYASDGRLIDSYMVFCRGEKLEYIESHKVRTTFNLADGTFTVYDNNVIFSDEMEIPVEIRTDGMLEVFPEDDYSDLEYADGCGANSFYDKYPLDEDWTVLDLQGKTVENVKTIKHYTDELNGVTTVFDKKVGDYSNLGVKGKHLRNDVSFVELDSLVLTDEKLKQLISKAQSQLDFYRYDGSRDFTISASYRYSAPEGSYCLLVVSIDFSTDSYKDTKDMLVGVFSNKVYQLASTCFYLEYDGINVFTVGGTPHLYTVSTSCGEGAAANRHIYRLNNGFEEVFQLFTSHD